KVLGTATLPSITLGRLRASTVSPDLTRVALSGPARGALWDLTSGRGIAAVPAFAGGHFAADGQLYVDVQPLLGLTRQIARVDMGTGQMSPVGNIGEGVTQIFQAGAGVLSLRPERPQDRTSASVVLEMRDATSLAPLWNHTFPVGAPRVLRDAPSRNLFYAW